MVCGKCGLEFSDDVKFCTNCGSELAENVPVEAVPEEVIEENASVVIETVEEEAAPDVEEPETEADKTEEAAVAEAVKEEVVVADTETKKAKKEKKNGTLISAKKPSWKVLLGLGLAAVLVLVVFVAVLVSGKEAFVTISEKAVLEFYEENEQLYAYLQNGEKVLLNDSEADVYDTSLDRTTVCYSNENHELVIFKNGKSIKTGIEEARGVKVSAEGDTFVYFSDCEDVPYFNVLFGGDNTTETGTLHLYFIDKGKDIRIAGDVAVNSAVLSPDGETVAYVADYEASDDFKGYYSVKGKKPVEIGKEKRVFAVADKAAYLYYTDDDRIYAQKKKEAGEKLASDVYGTSVLLNADCTEMLFLYEGKTYLTVKAGEKKKISADELNAVIVRSDMLVKNDMSRSDKGTVLVSYTGADTFKEKLLYCTTGRDIVYLKDDLETERLASDTKQYAVADDKASLVYIDGADIVKVTDFTNGGVKTDLKEDAEASELYAAGDLKYVYYVNKDEELFCIKGKKAKKIADDVSSVVLSADGSYCYYVVDDEKLCYSKNGKKGKELLEKDEVMITCKSIYGVSTVSVTEAGTVTEYRMDGKKMEQVRSYEEKSIEELLKEKYGLDEPLDYFLN